MAANILILLCMFKLGMNPGMGLSGLKPYKQKYCPPNEMKPISLFGLGLMFFATFVSKIFRNYIIFENIIFRFKTFWLKLQPKLAPPKPKILATSLNESPDL